MRIDQLTPTGTILRELGQRLANVRKQQGLSQESLAAAAGIGVATLRRIEDGKDSKLGSWLRLLLALQMEATVDGLLPENFRSPLAEVKGRRKRATKPGPSGSDGDRGPGAGFRWGDERP
ncbi:MAG: helix-turn-helix domain-containing protein [Planctomycetes bacterium]|nr:helix-turn-helix domain-containing protein [Planctomycetota bacterium]MCB9885805.1 helix-turn-helix domain-containing protein [Planctomycetota bacterium]